jgi:hypothetical protein
MNFYHHPQFLICSKCNQLGNVRKIAKSQILIYVSESENEPNRTELKRFGSVRVEPIRTRTDILKNESNRTEPEPAF